MIADVVVGHVRLGAIATNPPVDWPATVTLPETATVPVGTKAAMENGLIVPLVSALARPRPERVSTVLTGEIGKYAAPPGPGR